MEKNTIATAATKKSSDVASIEELDNKVADMTSQLQDALDKSAENFAGRMELIEASIKALHAQGVAGLRASEESKEAVAQAATKKQLRNALYGAVDEHVASSELEGKVRKVLHIERRTAIAAGLLSAVGGAATAVFTGRYLARRAAAKTIEVSTESPVVEAEI
jgi:hypothetical protein